jgi:hypothetical protein
MAAHIGYTPLAQSAHQKKRVLMSVCDAIRAVQFSDLRIKYQYEK